MCCITTSPLTAGEPGAFLLVPQGLFQRLGPFPPISEHHSLTNSRPSENEEHADFLISKTGLQLSPGSDFSSLRSRFQLRNLPTNQRGSWECWGTNAGFQAYGCGLFLLSSGFPSAPSLTQVGLLSAVSMDRIQEFLVRDVLDSCPRIHPVLLTLCVVRGGHTRRSSGLLRPNNKPWFTVGHGFSFLP